MAARVHEEPPGSEQKSDTWPAESEMARRIRAFDWSTTPLGPLTGWPNSLRAAVAVCLHSRFQMAIYWGPELNFIYNDAEREVVGELHPRALGMPARELLRDMWDVVEPQLRAVMDRGEATWAEDQPLAFNRRGIVETLYFTYSYSPIPDDQGRTGGVLLVTQETTARVNAQRRLDALSELTTRSMDAPTAREACRLAAHGLEGFPELGSVLIYLIDDERRAAVCVAASEVDAGERLLETTVELGSSDPLAVLFAELASSPGQSRVVDALPLFAHVPGGGTGAVAVATGRGSNETVDGFVVAVVQDDLGRDEGLRQFVEMVGLGIGRSVAAGREREEERARARQLAAAEKAKTAQVEEQYRRIFEAATDGLVVIELETGVAVELNPAYCRMHGYDYEEMIGANTADWIHPDDHDLFAQYLEAISEGRDFWARARQVHKDGSIFHVEVRGTTFLFRGRRHALAILRDISNEVEATRLLEQRVAERTQELTSLLSLANQAAAAHELGQLVAVVLPEVERMLECSAAAVYVKDGDSLRAVHAPASQAFHRPLPEGWDALRAGGTMHGEGELATLFPEGVPASCTLVIPLVVSSEAIGILCLTRPKGLPFQEEQRVLARGAGDQLSVAIGNARYLEAAQETAALEERQRIARDLHDSVSQSLFSLNLRARTAELGLAAAGLGADSDLGQTVGRMSELTRGALAEMRALIFELRPGALAEEGLGAALFRHASAVTAREGLPITVSVPDERLRLSVDQKEHLYRLAQEALHNVVKHAEAGQAWVELEASEAEVVLTVRDDGVGFDARLPRPGHLGLQTMRDRAAHIGGELRLTSDPGAGTTVRVRVPAGAQSDPRD